MTDPATRERASPNHDERRGVAAPDLIILHYTNMETAAAALDRLCDPAAQVSAHYLIEPCGGLWRLVPEERRAWHAGVSYWSVDQDKCPNSDVNSRSIGVELAHPGHSPQGDCAPFPEAQMGALELLLRGVMDRWAIPPHKTLAHSDVAPGRKVDPGEKLDWARLARAGLAQAHPGGAPPLNEAPAERGAAAFRAETARIGYGDWPDAALLDAFRRRWRPWALGRPLQPEDVDFARRLGDAAAQRRS